MSRKERKSKGTLSILDEFTSETGAGELTYSPTASSEVMNRIAEATKLADIPLSSRSPQITVDEITSQMATLAKKNKSDQTIESTQRDNKVGTQPSAIYPTSKEHGSNIGQTSVKPSSEHGSNIGQTSVKPSSEVSANATLEGEIWFKPSSKSGAFVGQTSVKPSSNLVQKFDFHMLSPIQQRLLIFLYENGKISRAKISSPLNGSILANRLNASLEGLRTAVKRLIKAGFLMIADVKPGRTGWTKYEMPEFVYQQMTLNESWFKSSSNLVQMSAKPSSKPSSEPSSEPPYSSSNNLNINTNTIELPENLRRFGISTVNLEKLISSGKTTQEVIARSLAALSFDVDNGKTGNLANILFGVLGTGREYISQKYSEVLQKELDAEIARMKLTEEAEKKLQETKLQMKFKEYLEQNPDFLDSVQKRHEIFVNNPSVLEKVAFEEFKEKGLGNV